EDQELTKIFSFLYNKNIIFLNSYELKKNIDQNSFIEKIEIKKNFVYCKEDDENTLDADFVFPPLPQGMVGDFPSCMYRFALGNGAETKAPTY
ncbi:MAG: hypothetical protein ACPHP5_06710, partial [Candidatus Puniceispirillaceae bacterium]